MASIRSKQFMAYSYQQILEAQYQRIADEHAEQTAELEVARVGEDAYRVTAAADRILELDKSREALDRRAQQYLASQQAQPQISRYGLSRDEAEIARGIAGNDRSLSSDDRERIFAENKLKLARARADGSYRDDQGRVTR
jgi:hypothetical protein